MTSKVGRPPLVNVRKHIIGVRLSTHEMSDLHHKAVEAGMTLSSYIRFMAVNRD